MPIQHASASRLSMTDALTILHGSSTGNARRLAERLAQEASLRGIPANTDCLSHFDCAQLAAIRRLTVVIGTWGDGEPPDAAKGFCSRLFAGEVPSLEHMEFAVLALGDSCFRSFCGCGVKVDECLARHGARRLLACRKLDAKYHHDFLHWKEEFLGLPLPARTT